MMNHLGQSFALIITVDIEFLESLSFVNNPKKSLNHIILGTCSFLSDRSNHSGCSTNEKSLDYDRHGFN